jgi:hypothetical protein
MKFILIISFVLATIAYGSLSNEEIGQKIAPNAIEALLREIHDCPGIEDCPGLNGYKKMICCGESRELGPRRDSGYSELGPGRGGGGYGRRELGPGRGGGGFGAGHGGFNAKK